MSKPTPGADLTNKFIGIILSHGGKMGAGKLREELKWRESDFDWVKTHLLSTGNVKMGRGRGGSIQVTQEQISKPAETHIVNLPESKLHPTDPDAFDLIAEKQKYKPLPEDTSAFKPGMKVARLATHLYSNEEHAWKYMNHYVVTAVKEDKIFVVPKNVKGADPISTNPVRFYTTK
jgi:hypothetical protein